MSDEELDIEAVVDRTKREDHPHPQDVEILAQEARNQRSRLQDELAQHHRDTRRLRKALRELADRIVELEASLPANGDNDG